MRLAEFEDLFRANLVGIQVLGPRRARFDLVGGNDLLEVVKDLSDRESQCCSFFDFTVTERPLTSVEGGSGSARAHLDVAVPAEHQEVLDSLIEHARDAQSGGSDR